MKRRTLLGSMSLGFSSLLGGCVFGDRVPRLTIGAEKITATNTNEDWVVSVELDADYRSGLGRVGIQEAELLFYDSNRTVLSRIPIEDTTTQKKRNMATQMTPSEKSLTTSTESAYAEPSDETRITTTDPFLSLPEEPISAEVKELPHWISFSVNGEEGHVRVTAYEYTGKRPPPNQITTVMWKGTVVEYPRKRVIPLPPGAGEND